MNLNEAILSASEGNFITHISFDRKESMHEYDGKLYYEDGADLTTSGFIDALHQMAWAKEGWEIKYPKERVDSNKLIEMHKDAGHSMLYKQSYEDCIIKEGEK